MLSAPSELRRAIVSWVLQHLERFALPGAPDPLLALKPLGELAMLGELLRRHEAATDDSRTVLEFAWATLGGGVRLADAIETNTAYATLYPLFHTNGYRNARIEELLRDPTWLARVPRMPLQFPIELVRRSVGLSEHWNLEELLLETTVLPHHPKPGSIADFLVYTMTHTVFHLTAYGLVPSAVADRDRVYLRDSIPAWLEHYHRLGNVDLVAELVMTAHCVNVCACTASVWDLIASAQQADGAIRRSPGATLRGRDYPERFLAIYHPTLVSAMACVMCEVAS